MLTPYFPYPLVSGGQIRSYNLIKHLSKKHEITLFSFLRQDESDEYQEELKKYCRKVKIFRRSRAWASLTNILFTAVSPYPYLVSLYYSWPVRIKKAIDSELKKEDYDLIHAETFYVMPNIPETQAPILLVEQTIEYLVYQHYTEELKFWPLKLPLYFDVLKLKFWERHFWQKADRVVAMSENDCQIMKQQVSSLQVDIVPNGVDVDFFSKVKRKKDGQKTVLFVGNFNWLQNREAVEILVKKVWPVIKKSIKDVRLLIVGRNPTEEVRRLGDDNIIVRGDIDDIRKIYEAADVLLAPIRGGGGTRFKILEAMVAKVPVVSTSIGIKGLDVIDEEQALIRDTEEEMALATINLLDNKPKAKALAGKAHDFVIKNFGWKDIAEKLDRIYEEVGKKQR